MNKLSICIPTFNRPRHLNNCLNSIYSNLADKSLYDVCISDNNSTKETEKVISSYKDKLNIIYKKNSNNVGVANNIVLCTSLSTSEYCWVIGDDDLLFNYSIKKALELIDKNNDADFFYVNSNHLDYKFLENYSHPFDTKNLPSKMNVFSEHSENFKCNFIDLINPKISFDFLGGLYLSIFRRELWTQNIDKLSKKDMQDNLQFSNFNNTFPHITIFSYAFSNSKAYFYSNPMTVNLYGVREWTSLYPIVRSIRLPEATEIYLKNGLSFKNYLICKNYSLMYFIPDIVKLIINWKISYRYFGKIIIFYLKNFYFPNIYFSMIFFFLRKIKNLFKK